LDSGVYLIDAATREPIKEVAVQGFFESGGDVSDSTNPSEDVLDAPWAGTETTEIPACDSCSWSLNRNLFFLLSLP